MVAIAGQVKRVLGGLARAGGFRRPLEAGGMNLRRYSAQIDDVERRLQAGEALAPRLLSEIPVEVLGLLYLSGFAGYPRLGSLLPAMPPEQVQRHWTGGSGEMLMAQSCAFVKSMVGKFDEVTGKDIASSLILDYGCGWGRLCRLMLKYAPAANIWGVDPWDESIRVCREYGVPVNLAISDYVPESLPVSGARFDLLFAFSIFTHLSENTALKVVDTLRGHAGDDALLVVTIRPPEYWRIHKRLPAGIDAAGLMADHESKGFAFVAHNRAPINGEITYGDASMSLEYMQRSWKGWEILGTAAHRIDPYQLVVFLQPA